MAARPLKALARHPALFAAARSVETDRPGLFAILEPFKRLLQNLIFIDIENIA